MSDRFGSSRKNQHKPTRDERQSKEFQELRTENRSLRKQLTRLRRELQDSEPIGTDDIESAKSLESVPTCNFCNSAEVKWMKTPVGTLNKCMSCLKSWKT